MRISYIDTLVGEIPGAYEHAFKFDIARVDEEEAETDLEPLLKVWLMLLCLERL